MIRILSSFISQRPSLLLDFTDIQIIKWPRLEILPPLSPIIIVFLILLFFTLLNPYKTYFLIFFSLADWVKQLRMELNIILHSFECLAREGKLAIFLAFGGRWNVWNHRTRKKSGWHYLKLIFSWRPTILDVIKAYLTSGCLIFSFIISTWRQPTSCWVTLLCCSTTTTKIMYNLTHCFIIYTNGSQPVDCRPLGAMMSPQAWINVMI